MFARANGGEDCCRIVLGLGPKTRGNIAETTISVPEKAKVDKNETSSGALRKQIYLEETGLVSNFYVTHFKILTY